MCCRFLRKDIETTKWEDVGDETAREKASQVLRDAVSEKNGPMAKSKRKSNTVSANSFPTDIAGATARKYSKENLVQVDHMQGAGNHHNFSRSAPLIRGMPPGTISSSYAHPYREYTAILGPPSVPITPRYPPVTPASESLPRKRPRAHDSPMTVHSYNYFSPHGSSFVPNASPGMGFPSPASRAFLSQGSPGYFSQSSFSGSRQLPSPSPMISEPHSSDSRLNESWVADIHSHYAPRRSSIAPAGDFDPYNEEILSDHSDHRDGSVSPFAYEKRDSL